MAKKVKHTIYTTDDNEKINLVKEAIKYLK